MKTGISMVELNHKRKQKARNQRELIKQQEAKIINQREFIKGLQGKIDEQAKLVELCMRLTRKDIDCDYFLKTSDDIQQEALRIIENRKG